MSKPIRRASIDSTMTQMQVLSPSLRNAWERAIGAQLAKLTADQCKLLSRTLEASELGEWLGNLNLQLSSMANSKARKYQTTAFLNYLEIFAKKLQLWQGAVEAVVHADVGIGALVWSPMMLVLTVHSKHGTSFDKLAELFTKLSATIPRYESYNSIFRDSELVQDSLGNLYLDYLDLCVKIVKYYEASSGIIGRARSLVHPFDEQFKDILESINFHCHEVEENAELASRESVQNVKRKTSDDRRLNMSIQEANEQDKVLHWLSPATFELETYIYEQQIIPETCQWLLKREEYMDWYDESSHVVSAPKILWVSGGAGLGKSFLAEYVRRQVKQSRSPVAYFFFSSKQPASQNRTTILFLRTILHQLLVRISEHTYRRAAFSILRLLVDSSVDSVASSPEELWTALKRIVYLLPRVFLVVDALDECLVSERDGVLRRLAELAKSTSNVKIIVTGRPEMDLVETFESLGLEANARLTISNDDVKEDVRLYIRACFQRSKILRSPTIREKVEAKALKSTEDGMWIYARILLVPLEHEATDTLALRKLHTFPQTLTEYYSSFLTSLQNTSESNFALAKDIFLWTILARRPLRIQELILAIGAQRASKRSPGESDTGWPLMDPEAEIREACYPLVEVLQDGTVRVVHNTVTQFLLGDDIDGRGNYSEIIDAYGLRVPRAEHEMTMACASYLLEALKQMLITTPVSSPTEGTFPRKNTHIKPPAESFLSYCVLHWSLHASKSQTHFPEHQHLLLQLICEDDLTRSSYIKRRASLDPTFRDYFHLSPITVEPSPLHIATYHNLHNLAHALLRRGYDTSIIDAGGSTPLQVAVDKGYPRLQRLLKEIRGIDTEGKDKHGMNSLHHAAIMGHQDSIRASLKAGGRVNSVDNLGQTPLLLACTYSRLAVVRMLLRNGGDASIATVSGETPLSVALAKKNERVAECILHTGLRWEHLVDKNNSCLSSAAKFAEKGLFTWLLMLSGGDVGLRDKLHKTPLHHAARVGYLDMVELLCELSADVDAADHEGRTPLHEAAECGHLEVVRFLIEEGAQVNGVYLKDGVKKTAVQLATARGHEEVARLLLGAGAKVGKKVVFV